MTGTSQDAITRAITAKFLLHITVIALLFRSSELFIRISILVTTMAEEYTSWDQITSIEGLEVDWNYQPDSVLGKRAFFRLTQNDLSTLLGKDKIPAKVVSTDFNLNNQVVDICQIGMAVLSGKKVEIAEKVKVGLFLNKQKILSNATVRNVTEKKNHYRIGMEFDALNKDSTDYISSLVSSLAHAQ